MAATLTAADVRAAIAAEAARRTQHDLDLARGTVAPAAQPVRTAADVRAHLAGLESGSPTGDATTENLPGANAPGTDEKLSAPALESPAPPVGSDTPRGATAMTNADNQTMEPDTPGAAWGLPDDMPGHAALAAAGILTMADLLAVDDLTGIDGIGPATAHKIRARMTEATE